MSELRERELREKAAFALLGIAPRKTHPDNIPLTSADRVLAALGLDDLDAAVERAYEVLTPYVPLPPVRDALLAALTPPTSSTHDPEVLPTKAEDA